MRYFAPIGLRRYHFVPFLSIVRDVRAIGTIGLTWQQAVELWYRIAVWKLRIRWTIDPLTSATGQTSYTREILLVRNLYESGGFLLERALLFPGIQTDILHPYGVGGTIVTPQFSGGLYSAFTFTAAQVLQGPDDVFDSTAFSAEMSLFMGGFTISPITGATTVTVKLRSSLIYDDGTEGELRVDSVTTDFPPGTFLYEDGVNISVAGAGTIAGKTVDSAGAASAYHHGGAAPLVELTPVLWFEYRRADGSAPLFDAATGALLGNPLERRL